MSRVFNYCKSRAPIPEFDNHVRFEDYVVIDRVTKRPEKWPIDGHTGELLTDEPLPAEWEIGNHRYFYNGRPVFGSVTAAEHAFFPGFDSESVSSDIASRDSILYNSADKYFRIGHEEMRQQWEALRASVPGEAHLLDADVDKHFEQLAEHRGFAVFRQLYQPVAKAALLANWEANRDQAGEKGTEFHLLVQRFYEKDLVIKNEPACNTVEFQQFRRFHHEWVTPRELTMLRTELSMFCRRTGMCGTIDALYVMPNQEALLDLLRAGETLPQPIEIVIADWKRSDKIRNFPKKKPVYGNAPFDDWLDGTISERWFQLMTYAHIIETNTNHRFKVVSAHAICFHPRLADYNVCDVPLDDTIGKYTRAERMERLFTYLRDTKIAALRAERETVAAAIARGPFSARKIVTQSPANLERAHALVGNMIRLHDIDAQLAELADFVDSTGKRKK